MTAAQSLAAFSVAAGLLTVMPGLDTALVLRLGLTEGRRQALAAGLGICVGTMVWGAAVAVGVAGLLAASAAAYTVLRWVGAAYLVWLGLKMLLKPRDSALPEAAAEESQRGAAAWFGKGLLTNLLNPKVGVFYVSFLPQFVPAGGAVGPWTMLFAGIHSVMGMAWFVALVLASAPLGRRLRDARVVRALDRMTGGVFLLFGARLALDRR